MVKIVKYLLVFLLFSGGVCTLLSFFGQFDWRFDLLSHFRLQYLLFFSVLILFALYLRAKLFVGVTLVFLLINLIPFIPFYFPAKEPLKESGIVVMMANVNKENRQFAKVKSAIQNVNPDIIILVEIDEAWSHVLSGLKNNYPYKVSEVREDYFGILILSKYPLKNPTIERFGSLDAPTLAADAHIDGKSVTVMGTHPLPPFSRYNTKLRNKQLERIGQFINKQKKPVLLVGDINSTVFSYPYRTLLKQTTLKNCANGFGYQSTWHMTPAIPPFGLWIDHCFYTRSIVILDSYTGDDIGSDHKPIITRISLP